MGIKEYLRMAFVEAALWLIPGISFAIEGAGDVTGAPEGGGHAASPVAGEAAGQNYAINQANNQANNQAKKKAPVRKIWLNGKKSKKQNAVARRM